MKPLTPSAPKTSPARCTAFLGINASKRIVVKNVRTVGIVNSGKLLTHLIA